MNLWSKIFIGLIIPAGLGLIVLAAMALKVHWFYRYADTNSVYNSDQKIADLERRVAQMRDGNPAQQQLSLDQLRIDIYALVAGRGVKWSGVRPAAPGADGSVQVEMAAANHQLDTSKIVYVFDEPRQPADPNNPAGFGDGGRYLGRYKVTASDAAGTAVTLAPAIPHSAREAQHVTDSVNQQFTWSLYLVMPADRRDQMATLTEQQLAAAYPAPQKAPGETDEAFQAREAVRAQIFRDGKPPQPGDPDERIVLEVQFTQNDKALLQRLNGELGLVDPASGQPTVDADGLPRKPIPDTVLTSGLTYEYPKEIADQLIAAGIAKEISREYRRPLRDYAWLFQDLENEQALLLDSIDAMVKDVEYMTRAHEDAKKHLEAAEKERDTLTAERTRVEKEQKLAEARRDRMATELAESLAAIDDLRAENKELAARLAEAQRSAAQQIEDALRAQQASNAP
jgi:hypothetical protein